MNNRLKAIALSATCALGLGACAGNYAAEGALGGAAVGAATSVLTGGSVTRGAAVGADGRCFRIDDDGHEYRVRCPD